MFERTPKLRLFINLLLIVEIFIGVTIIGVTWFSQRLLSSFLTETEGKMLTSKFFNVYILGFQMVASFVCGMSLWASVWPRRFSENIHLLLSTWLIFCFLVVACGCANIWILLTSSDSVSEGAEILLLKGIDNYYLNPEWKLLWDLLQYSRECCGVHGYRDWLQANWMTENVRQYRDVRAADAQSDFSTTECVSGKANAKPDNNAQQLVMEMADSPQILAPYACCKHNSTRCYENYMPHMRREGNPIRLPHLNLKDINSAGCFPIFTRHLKFSVNVVFILILLAVFVDILLCSLTKYVMATNYKRYYRQYNMDSCMMDDEGNALVVIKCPPNVRCITLEEPNTFNVSDIPNVASSCDMCQCCNGHHENVIDVEHHAKREEHNNNNNLMIVH